MNQVERTFRFVGQARGRKRLCLCPICDTFGQERKCPMAKTEFIRARIEPELKTQAEEILSKLGLSPNRCDHAVLCPGHPARWLALRGEDSECRNQRSATGSRDRSGPKRICRPTAAQDRAWLILGSAHDISILKGYHDRLQAVRIYR